MDYVLLAAVLFLSGGVEPLASHFDTEKECTNALPILEAKIAEYNMAEPNKIVKYSAVCMPMVKAPQGQKL